MDTLLLFLMHTLGDLKITEEDLLALLNLQPADRFALEEMLISSRSRLYVAQNPDWFQSSLRLLSETRSRGIRWCRFGDPDYPVEWLNLSHKPLLFHYMGEPVWRTQPLLAVVGSRTPMQETMMWMQRELGIFLRQNEAGVVSGGARGVDSWAHRISMECGRPTVCILPSGVLRPYPSGSEPFLRDIVREGGAVLSTFHPFSDMRKSHFAIRNRWIAGISPLCFVVEANRRSGSMLTADCAQQEHRSICTLPVFPHSDQGLANLDLLMDGAAMIRHAADLKTVWDLNLRPTLFQAAKCKEKENDVHDPESGGGGKPTTAGNGFGRQIENPVGNQKH